MAALVPLSRCASLGRDASSSSAQELPATGRGGQPPLQRCQAHRLGQEVVGARGRDGDDARLRAGQRPDGPGRVAAAHDRQLGVLEDDVVVAAADGIRRERAVDDVLAGAPELAQVQAGQVGVFR